MKLVQWHERENSPGSELGKKGTTAPSAEFTPHHIHPADCQPHSIGPILSGCPHSNLDAPSVSNLLRLTEPRSGPEFNGML